MTDEMINIEEEMIPEEAQAEDIEPENTVLDEAENIEALKQEIAALKAQLTELNLMKENHQRMLAEITDLHALFPDAELDMIPEEVWESVKKGSSLVASYALYEKRMRAEEERIAKINASNAKRSAGIAGKDTAGEYFTPDEVRRMSPAEVHANYSKIKASMKKWM